MSNVYDYNFVTKSGDLSDIDYDDAIWLLKEYEDTDLSPQQIKDMQFCLREKSRECAELRRELQEIKKRNEPMKINEIHVDEYYCPACGAENNCDQEIVGDRYCPMCGQAIQHDENSEGTEGE